MVFWLRARQKGFAWHAQSSARLQPRWSHASAFEASARSNGPGEAAAAVAEAGFDAVVSGGERTAFALPAHEPALFEDELFDVSSMSGAYWSSNANWISGAKRAALKKRSRHLKAAWSLKAGSAFPRIPPRVGRLSKAKVRIAGRLHRRRRWGKRQALFCNGRALRTEASDGKRD